jgi:hypothetical protein
MANKPFETQDGIKILTGDDIVDENGDSLLGGSGLDGVSTSTPVNPSVGFEEFILTLNTESEEQKVQIVVFKKTPSVEGQGDNYGPALGIGTGVDGEGSHGDNAIAIGNDDVGWDQGANSIAIGYQAGWGDDDGIGADAIAIGHRAAYTSAPANSITLNATGQNLDPDEAGFFVKPVREEQFDDYIAYYNPTSGEFTYAANPGTNSVDNNIWVQTFITDNDPTDIPQAASSVEYDADGNIVALFSHIDPINPANYFSVAKFDSAGTKLWSVRFQESQYTDGWGLAIDNVNGYVYIAGESEGTGSPESYQTSTLTKLNSVNGNLIWMKYYDFNFASNSAVVDIASDGNPVMVGYVDDGDGWITTTKVDATDGTVIWSRKLNGQNDEQALGMAVGPNGEIVAVGFMDNIGLINTVATLTSDPVSNVNWSGTYTGVFIDGVTFDVSFTDGVPSFTVISDTRGNWSQNDTIGQIDGSTLGGASGVDNLSVKVATVTLGDIYDQMLVVKYGSDGSIQWQKAIQFDSGYDCKGADADIDSLGNIYVCGSYQRDYNGGTTSAMAIFKLDSNGAKQWTRRVVGDCDDFATSIVVGPDDCVYLSAVTGTNATSDYSLVLAKYDTSGLVVWQRLLDNTTTWSFGGTAWFSGRGGSNLAVRTGYLVVSGTFGDPGTQPYAVVAQVSSSGSLFSVGNWDFKGSSFSGILNGTASDITVSSANKTDSSQTVLVTSVSVTPESSNFLIGTRYRQGIGLGNITVDDVTLIGTGDDSGLGGLYIAPGPDLFANNQYWRFRGGDNPTHLHLDTSDDTLFDQYFGDDNKYLKLTKEGPISIGTSTHVWTFKNNGETTFPTLTVPISDNATPSGIGQTIKFSDPTQQAIIFGPPSTETNSNAERIIIQGAPGLAGTGGEGGDVYLWAGPGGDVNGSGGDIKIRAGRAYGTGSGGYLNFQAGNTVDGTGGYINIESGSSTNGVGGNVTITANNGGALALYTESGGDITINTANGGNVWTFSSTGSIGLPGVLVNSTATKDFTAGLGIPLTLSDSTWPVSLTDGSYGPFTYNGITFTVQVTSGMPIYTITANSGPIAVNTVIVQLDAGELGGTPGNTSNVQVASVNDSTEIDITKSVNKLEDGSYTLANGVEGQIMYLVAQTGTTMSAVTVIVSNARINGGTYTDTALYPFLDYNAASNGGMCTLIFTDGHWQSNSGWD